ncbi:hypothetical protein JXA40_00880 [bacterium]|nr:hypothetical protein [candidate division CSSED10-310 bacterium]
MQWLIKSGILLVVAGLAAFFYKDAGHALPISQQMDTYMILLGMFLIVLYFGIYIAFIISGQTWKRSHQNRCVRCGKKIPKGEIYCEFHRMEVQTEYLMGLSDRHRPEKE